MVNQNNEFGENLNKEKDSAKEKLRKSIIWEMLKDFHFETKTAELNNAKKIRDDIQVEIKKEKVEKENIQQVIKYLEDEIDRLKPKAEEQAIKILIKSLKVQFLGNLIIVEKMVNKVIIGWHKNVGMGVLYIEE